MGQSITDYLRQQQQQRDAQRQQQQAPAEQPAQEPSEAPPGDTPGAAGLTPQERSMMRGAAGPMSDRTGVAPIGTAADSPIGIVSGLLDTGAEIADGFGLFWSRASRQALAAPGSPAAAANAAQTPSARVQGIANALLFRGLVGAGVVREEDGEVLPDAPRLVTAPDTVIGNMSDGIAQFVGGYVVAGRLMRLGRPAILSAEGGAVTATAARAAAAEARVAARPSLLRQMGGAAVQGGIADFAAFDGNEARLSNVLRDIPQLRGPVLDFLAADENDDELEGRIASVIEGLGLGIIADSLMAGFRAVRGQRLFTRGAIGETDVADLIAQAEEATLRDAESLRLRNAETMVGTARRNIDETFDAALRDLETQFQTDVAPRAGEMGNIAAGLRDPTYWTQRQTQVWERYKAQRDAYNAQRVLEHRKMDLIDAVEKRDMRAAIQIAEELGTPITLRSGNAARRVGTDTLVDDAKQTYRLGEFVPTMRDGRLVLMPGRTVQTAGRGFTAARPSVNIVPDKPAGASEMVRAALDQSLRLEDALTRAATAGERTALKAQSDRLAEVARELEAAEAAGEGVDAAAARLMALLDDEATESLFPRRGAVAADSQVGTTTRTALQRARGMSPTPMVAVDEDLAKAIAERYARIGDVASHTVRAHADAWNDGVPNIRARDMRLEHIDSEDAVKAYINVAADLLETPIRTIRGETVGPHVGVRTDRQRNAVAGALAKDMASDGQTLVQRLALLTEGTENLDSKLLAAAALHRVTADEALKASRAFLADQNDDTASRMLIALQSFAATHGALKGAQSEVGRALRALQSDITGQRGLLENLSTMVDESLTRALDPSGGSHTGLDALRRLAAQVNDLGHSRQAMGRIFSPSWTRAIEDYYTASILSAPPTHVLNFVGNVFTTVMAPIEKFIGSAVRLDREGVQEAWDHAVGILITARESASWAGRALRENRTFLDNTFDADHASNFNAAAFGLNPNKPLGASFELMGNIVGVVHRVMGANDEFFKQLNYRADLYASAMSHARELNIRDGDALRNFVDEFISAGFDKTGRSSRAGLGPEAIDIRNNAYDRALQLARRGTFTEAPGRITGAIERALRAVPFMRLVVPFFRTPVNIIKYAARRTPFLSKTFRDDFFGKNGPIPQRNAYGMLATGAVIYGSAITYAMEGNLTGNGPTNPEVRQALVEAGWQPYSIRIGDRYVSYNRADPVGLMLGVVADLYERLSGAYEEAPPGAIEDAAIGTIVDIAQNLKDKTFFQGIDAALGALERGRTPEQENENLEAFYSRVAGGFIPSVIQRATSDGIMRKPRNLTDALMVRWNDERVEMRRNFFGEPLRGPEPLGAPAWVSPFVSTDAGEDPVLTEIARLSLASNAGLRQIPRTVDGVRFTDFTAPTGRNAYDRLQELVSTVEVGGKTFRQATEELVTSERWERMTDGTLEDGLSARGTRLLALTRLRTRYINAATRELRIEIPELAQELDRARALQRSSRVPTMESTDRSETPPGLEWLAPLQQ